MEISFLQKDLALFNWLLLCWALGYSQMSLPEAFKNHFSVLSLLQPMGLVGATFNGFQRQMLWGLVSQVQILKVGVLDVGFKHFLFKEKLWVLSSLLILGCRTWDGGYGKIGSQPFLLVSMWVFSCLLIQFLGPFQKKYFHTYLEIWCVHGRR